MGCGCGKKSTAPSAPRISKTAPKSSGNTPKKIRRVIRKTSK